MKGEIKQTLVDLREFIMKQGAPFAVTGTPPQATATLHQATAPQPQAPPPKPPATARPTQRAAGDKDGQPIGESRGLAGQRAAGG